MSNPEKANQKFWDEVAPVHKNSYDIKGLFEKKSLLNSIQMEELGDISGKKVLHLQCHIGTDTLSIALMGADVTGVDFSEESVNIARMLSNDTGIDARFIHSNIYDLKNVLNEDFDIVYTSEGVLCWLKDLKEWGKIISHYLKPGGFFYIEEGHPFLQIFNNEVEGLIVSNDYFCNGEPVKWESECQDYSDENYIVKNPTHEWTWKISDIINALTDAGLCLEFIHEHNRMFYKAMPSMKKHEDGYWYLPGYENKIPLVFTIKAKKRV